MSSSHTTRFLAPPVGYWELPYIIIVWAIYVYLIHGDTILLCSVNPYTDNICYNSMMALIRFEIITTE
jgi:hypothetical protein